MKWIDVSNGCGGHNGEYDWKCSQCGNVDWQARGVNPNEDGTVCRRCRSRPEGEKKPESRMTSDELIAACNKFRSYLEANGVRVLHHALYVTGTSSTGTVVVDGSNEMMTESIMHQLCILRGMKAEPR